MIAAVAPNCARNGFSAWDCSTSRDDDIRIRGRSRPMPADPLIDALGHRNVWAEALALLHDRAL